MDVARFVVQEHTTPEGVHWDLMLEHDTSLLTFRLTSPPTQAAAAPSVATKIFDHALRFLTYEGSVQHNTGRVRIVEHGVCCIESQTDAQIVFALSGRTLHGTFTLTRVEGVRWSLTPPPAKS